MLTVTDLRNRGGHAGLQKQRLWRPLGLVPPPCSEVLYPRCSRPPCLLLLSWCWCVGMPNKKDDRSQCRTDVVEPDRRGIWPRFLPAQPGIWPNVLQKTNARGFVSQGGGVEVGGGGVPTVGIDWYIRPGTGDTAETRFSSARSPRESAQK